MPMEVFQHRTFTRLKQLEFLMRTRQIDGQFFWNAWAPAFGSTDHANGFVKLEPAK